MWPRVLVNATRDARSRRWTAEVPTDALPDAVCEEESLTGLEVRRALASLSPEHRVVLVLRYLADLAEAHAARVLGVPVGTVKSRAARAIAALSSHPSLRSPDAQ